MTEIVSFPNNKAKITREACEWLARMDGHELSQEEITELNNWVKQSKNHKEELKRLAAIWDNIDEMEMDNIPVVLTQNAHQKTRNNKLRFLKAIAASFLLVFCIGFLMHYHNLNKFHSTNGKYATNIGDQKTIILSDGSEIKLNTDTLIEVNFHDNMRNIHLFKGEAHFEVAHDPNKPFTVKANEGDVRALGTVFSVYVKNDRVNVIVEEGKVRIRANEKIEHPIKSSLPIPEDIIPEQQTNTIVANAGRNVVFGKQEIESIIKEEKEEIERRFSWHQGMLAFDDEPLSEVIDEVSRYTSSKIIIADPSIRSLRVGGYYPIGKLQVIFNALKFNLDLQIKQVDEKTYYISSSEA